MKKTYCAFRQKLMAFGLVLAGMVTITGCTKSLDNEYNDQDNIPVAGLMAFNLTADKAVGISLSGSYLTSQPLGYANFTGSYLRIYTGTRTVEARDGYTNNLLASASSTFDSSRYYSAFVIGANGAYRNVVVNDNFDSLSGLNGQAYIRYVNAIPDSVNAATVNISVNGSSISNRTAAYGTVSGFTAITPGQVNIAVNKTGVNKDRTINLEQRKVYTVLLSGIPVANATDSIDIRFITNGTLDNTATNGRTTSTSSNATPVTVQ